MLTISEMRDKLLPLDEVRGRLEQTDSLNEYEFRTDGSNDVQFQFPDTWAVGLKEMDDLDITSAKLVLDGTELALTKEAALDACAKVGISKAYATKTPGGLIQPHLDYWYRSGELDKGLKVFASHGTALGFTRDTVVPYSNVEVLDRALDAIEAKYNTRDVLVDYKFRHDLHATNLRLIVPESVRQIASARAETGNDPWSIGLDIRNSITGAIPLEIRGYLFAWWCTNGATSTHASSGKYRRTPNADLSSVYEWARESVDAVLGDLDHELDAIAELPNIMLEGELNSTVNQIFEDYDIPAHQQASVMENLVESDDLSAYGLLAAITQAANDSDLSGNAVDALLTAGGGMAHSIGARCETCHSLPRNA